MRSTCLGARSGRSSITTLPLVVSSVSFSLSAIALRLSAVASVEEIDPERAACDRTAHCFRERHWRATVDRLGNRRVVALPFFVGDRTREVDDARLAEQFAGALEAHLKGDVNRAAAGVDRRGRPALRQRRHELLQVVY